MLDNITPVILTLNEEENIKRTISKLSWAKNIVVVDSQSTDGTIEILKSIHNVSIFTRKFDNHTSQWNFAIKETSITTKWVLALDADYVLSDELVDELRVLKPDSNIVAYQVFFRYCIFGKPLRGSIYPPVTVLYKSKLAHYTQDGHTQRVDIQGQVGQLKAVIIHDDRKSLARWLSSQEKYMKLEAKLINETPWSELKNVDRLRKGIIFAPIVTFFYCLFIKQVFLDGRAGLYYTMQRTLAEISLSIKLLSQLLSDNDQ